jgi:hypothetical protein
VARVTPELGKQRQSTGHARKQLVQRDTWCALLGKGAIPGIRSPARTRRPSSNCGSPASRARGPAAPRHNLEVVAKVFKSRRSDREERVSPDDVRKFAALDERLDVSRARIVEHARANGEKPVSEKARLGWRRGRG